MFGVKYFVLIAAKALFVSSQPRRCDSVQRVTKEGNIGETSVYPWLGLLKVHLRQDVTERIAVTGMVLVKPGFAIANADDVAKIPRRIFKEDTKAMFIPKDNKPWLCNVLSYVTHPEYKDSILNSISIIKLDLGKEKHFPMKPICWPHRPIKSVRDLYAIGFTDDNKIAEKTIFSLQYVDQKPCQEFYNRAGLTVKELRPMQFLCGFAKNYQQKCVWDNGLVLASNSTSYWTLIGFGIISPGCAEPARFIDISPYLPWIEAHTTTRVDNTNVPQYRRAAFNFEDVRTNAERVYEYFPVTSGRAEFEVMTRNDACIKLTAEPTQDAIPNYEIYIDGWSNRILRRSAIHKNRAIDHLAKVNVDTAQYFLNEYEYRAFWVEWRDDGTIAVGKKNETTPFISWKDPDPFEVKYLGVATAETATGIWKIRGESPEDDYGDPDAPGYEYSEHGSTPDKDYMKQTKYPTDTQKGRNENFEIMRINETSIDIVRFSVPGHYGNCSANVKLIYREETRVVSSDAGILEYRLSLYDLNQQSAGCVKINLHALENPEDAKIYYTKQIDNIAGTGFAQYGDTPESILKVYPIETVSFQPVPAPSKNPDIWDPDNLQPNFIKDERSIIHQENQNIMLRFMFVGEGILVIEVLTFPLEKVTKKPPKRRFGSAESIRDYNIWRLDFLPNHKKLDSDILVPINNGTSIPETKFNLTEFPKNNSISESEPLRLVLEGSPKSPGLIKESALVKGLVSSGVEIGGVSWMHIFLFWFLRCV